MKFCTHMYHDNLKNSVEFQGHRSKVKVSWSSFQVFLVCIMPRLPADSTYHWARLDDLVMYMCLYIRLSVCLGLCVVICLSVCMSVCVSASCTSCTSSPWRCQWCSHGNRCVDSLTSCTDVIITQSDVCTASSYSGIDIFDTMNLHKNQIIQICDCFVALLAK